MKTITDKTILDAIIKSLTEEWDNEGKSYASYEDEEQDIYIEASVQWLINYSENWITIDGCSYLEGTYDEVIGFDDLQVDAWVGDEKVDVYDYIEQNLYY